MAFLNRARAIPWMVALEIVLLARDRWGRLEASERSQLNRLVIGVTKDRRAPNAKERALLRSVAGKLDIPGAGRQLAPRIVRRVRGKR